MENAEDSERIYISLIDIKHQLGLVRHYWLLLEYFDLDRLQVCCFHY